ncbi:hypothetical protein [Streptomyces sp. NPDC059411]|uniref:hypothetical protein n=1 Tax=Streptomyces sp. NPDC059411 TaxID=3346825 RepID=UPI0036C17768
MTYARALRWTAGAALASAALLITAPANAGPSASTSALLAAPNATPAATPSGSTAPSGTATPSASAVAVAAAATPDGAFEELAGSAAGAGRERPGLPVTEPANPETVLAARPVPARPRTEPVRQAPTTPSASAPAPVSALGSEPNERAADLAAHILPLGTGFALMGLGFGFMGMRLRRGR